MARRRVRSTRGPRRPVGDGELGRKVAVALLVAFVVGALVLFVALWEEPVVRDQETNCPVDGPTAVTAIYVDTTDRVGTVSRADILTRLDAVVADTQPDEMVVAYSSAPIRTSGDPIEPLLTRCNPGDPESASPITSNPRLIRQRLADEFREPLDQVFGRTLDASPANASPLMENVQAISVMLFSRRQYADLPKHLVVVSDLMQHTENLSFYGEVPDYAAFARTAARSALDSDIRRVRVTVFLVQRETQRDIGGDQPLREFWDAWIADQGGRIERFVRISGLNAS